MTDSPTPGEPRLARPPSDRYPGEPASEAAATTGSPVRALAYGALAALAGVALTILLGGLLAFSAGLLVVWGSVGNAIGLVTKVGGGSALAAGPRRILAVGLALAGVALGQLGLWWYAGTEGGVLPLVDYLAQTFGILVPLQAALAFGFAWWAAR